MAAPNKSDKMNAGSAMPKGFDDYEIKLGDLLRGERATMGKSLLDVQRELRIRASYVAAIENCDPSAFETQGFVSGYVKSYARYLGLEPERVFVGFCNESGFAPAHGMSEKASSLKRANALPISARNGSPSDNPFSSPKTAFLPQQASMFASIEPGAIGSIVVLLALIASLGYGGYSLLQEIQRVEITPVEQTPTVLAELDPVNAAQTAQQTAEQTDIGVPASASNSSAMDQLYRPKALDLPILVPRDAPIATLDPGRLGLFPYADTAAPIKSTASFTEQTNAEISPRDLPSVPKVVADPDPTVEIFALRPAWVRVTSADGSRVFENTLNAGESFKLDTGMAGAKLRSGMSGYVYLKIKDQFYGPIGKGTRVKSDISLDDEQIIVAHANVTLEENIELAQKVAELNAAAVAQIATASTQVD